MKRFFPTLAAILVSVSLAWAASTVPIGTLTDNYNNAGTTFCSWCLTISGTSQASGTRTARTIYNGSEIWAFGYDGDIYFRSPSAGAWNVKLDQGSGPSTLISANSTSFGLGATAFTFGAPGNVGINKVNLTGAGVGAPTSCGGSPTKSTNAADFMGSVTTGSGATACTIPWSATKSAAPNCVVLPTDAGALPTIAPTTTNLVLSVARASVTYVWICNDKA